MRFESIRRERLNFHYRLCGSEPSYGRNGCTTSLLSAFRTCKGSNTAQYLSPRCALENPAPHNRLKEQISGKNPLIHTSLIVIQILMKIFPFPYINIPIALSTLRGNWPALIQFISFKILYVVPPLQTNPVSGLLHSRLILYLVPPLQTNPVSDLLHSRLILYLVPLLQTNPLSGLLHSRLILYLVPPLQTNPVSGFLYYRLILYLGSSTTDQSCLLTPPLQTNPVSGFLHSRLILYLGSSTTD